MDTTNKKINEEKEMKIRKKNMKIFPWYKTFGWDILFYYSISFLFLVDIKGLSPSQVILTDAFYPIFKFLLQPFASIIIEKHKKRNSLIFANCMITIYLFLIMFANGFYSIVFATLFCSLGYCIKNIAETNFLYESIPHCKNRGDIFGKLDGKGFTRYYIFDGITALFTGFTFVVNPYLPLIISILFNTIAIILSGMLEEIPKKKEQLKPTYTKAFAEYFSNFIHNFKYGFRYVHKSPRLRCLITTYCLFYGLLVLTLSLRRSLLKEMNTTSELYGIIFAIMGLIAAFTATKSNMFNKQFKNNTLTVLIIPYCVSCILIGIITTFNYNNTFSATAVFLLYALQYVIRGPFYTIIKRYLNNFSTTKARDNIYSVATSLESFVAGLITVIGAYIVEIMNSASAFIIIGIISTLIFIILLKYMKPRVGLKPEEYDKKEIEMLKID